MPKTMTQQPQHDQEEILAAAYWRAYYKSAKTIEVLAANHHARRGAPVIIDRGEIDAMDRFREELAAINVGFEQ